MSYRSSTGTFALAVALMMTLGGARAAEEMKYPDWKGQWITINYRLQGQVINAFDTLLDVVTRAATGERVWETQAVTGEKARWATAFIVRHGDRFFINNDHGELIIAKLTPQGYREISRAHLLEPTNTDPGRPVVWSHPAFANQCVYARNDKEIVCVSLAK